MNLKIENINKVVKERGFKALPIYQINGDGTCACGKVNCSSPGKHPIFNLVPHGLKDATTDSELITKWFTQCPGANVAYVVPENVLYLMLIRAMAETKALKS